MLKLSIQPKKAMKRCIHSLGIMLVSLSSLSRSSAFIPLAPPLHENCNNIASIMNQELGQNPLFMTYQNDGRILTSSENEFTSYQNFQERKRNWIDRSMQYYSTVMREERRRSFRQMSPEGQIKYDIDAQNHRIRLATKHYFALCLIKSGKLNHAEKIYRRKIDELMSEEGRNCDNSQLAVSTLLLALLLQRMGDIKGTRSVFLNFFRIVVVENSEEGIECACSAKVLQAYALFEMKRGHAKKSLEIVTEAVKMDKELAPVLKWKQFRDTMKDLSLANSLEASRDGSS